MNTTNTKIQDSIYNIELRSIDGSVIDLNEFQDRFILFVNVASKCGFTAQYKALQRLYETYQDRLMIIGLPCNQFGNQEPGTSEEIATFCSVNYGVTFPISEKLMVKGPDQHPLYQWLTSKKLNRLKNSKVKWNFNKYMVDPQGCLIGHFGAMTKPLSKKITNHLK